MASMGYRKIRRCLESRGFRFCGYKPVWGITPSSKEEENVNSVHRVSYLHLPQLLQHY